jgi:hypothetical protein
MSKFVTNLSRFAAIGAVALAGAACTPQGNGGGTPPSTVWPAAGCYTSAQGQNDIKFNGSLGTLNNASISISTDGTCSGPILLTFSLVSATSATEANTKCQAIDPNLVERGSPSGLYSSIPGDVYICQP